MSYAEVKKEYVIETIAKGDRVLLCDFSTMRMVDCKDLTIQAINSFINNTATKFFKEVSND